LSLILLKNFHAKSQSAQRKIKNLAILAALREKKTQNLVWDSYPAFCKRRKRGMASRAPQGKK